MTDKKQVLIEFDNAEAAKHFASWLCESGEQSYWLWMEYREQEDEGDITAVEFDYHTTPNKTFNPNYIKTKCGRLK